MENKPKESSEIRNSITGKTIGEMTWEEIRSLTGKRMTQAEAIRQMQERARGKKDK